MPGSQYRSSQNYSKTHSTYGVLRRRHRWLRAGGVCYGHRPGAAEPGPGPAHADPGKQRHPRPKLCGGGLTTHADVFLQRLGLIPDVPAVPIREVRFRFRGAQIRLRANIFRVIHRPEFDAWLANQVRAQGVELHEEEPLLDLRPAVNGVEVVTARYRGSSAMDWLILYCVRRTGC